MKILHISPMYFPALGGAEWHLKRLSECLASRGHEVTVLTANVRQVWDLWPGHCGGLPAEEVIESVQVRRFRPDGGRMGSVLETWERLPGGYRSLRALFGEDGCGFLTQKPLLLELIPYLLRARPDIVASVNWYWPPAYHTYLVRKLKRFTLVGIPLFHTAEQWCERSIYRKMLAQCNAAIANTVYEAQFIQARAPIRVAVAGVGIDPESFAHRRGGEIRARFGLGSRPVVGFVGRQAANKGATTVVQAMRTVWNWNPEVRLVLAGPRSKRHHEVDALIEILPESERARIVRMEDFQEADKASIHDSFDVFVLPSTGESFGIAYLEAWMCGKPVVGLRIGPTQCVIDEGRDGLLVSANAPEETARAIIELLSDREKRERMGRNGHAKTIAQFTWEKVTDRVERLYAEVLAAKRGDLPAARKAVGLPKSLAEVPAKLAPGRNPSCEDSGGGN